MKQSAAKYSGLLSRCDVPLSFVYCGMMAVILASGYAGNAAPIPANLELGTPQASAHASIIWGEDAYEHLGSDLGNGIAFVNFTTDPHPAMLTGSFVAPVNCKNAAGMLYILTNRVIQPGSSLDLNTDHLARNGETRFRGLHSRERFGYAVTAGDIDGDGLDDVVVGAKQTPGAQGADAGAVYIGFGYAPLLAASLDLSTVFEARQWATVTGAEAGDFFGTSVACGDFNGDGFADIVAGAPGTLDFPAPDGGAALILGGPEFRGLKTDIPALVASGKATTFESAYSGGRSGFAVAAGDFNGDGLDDAVISAVAGNPINNRFDAGEIYVYYGQTGPAGLSLRLGDPSPSGNPTRIAGAFYYDEAGAALAAGDIDGDGFDDLMLGARGADSEDTEDDTAEGEVYVIQGGSGMPGLSVDLNNPPIPSGILRLLGWNPGDRAGWSVAASDVNGDGLDDIVVGSPATLQPSSPGTVHLVHGSNFPFGRTLQLGSGVEAAIIRGIAPGDQFGYGGEGGGDVNGDGFADFAFSAFLGDNPTISGNDDAGYAALIYGGGTAPAARASEFFPPGAAPRRGMGGRLSPTVRAWLSFNGGDDGFGGASKATVTLVRSGVSIANLAPAGGAAVPALWLVETARTAFASAGVAFKFLDSEIAGLEEASLVLHRADSPSGPWQPVPAQTLDAERNRVSAETASLGYFALAGTFPPAPGPPVVAADPAPQSVNAGRDVYMEVRASGPGPYTYQWRFNGAPLPGKTGSGLVLPAIPAGDAGLYDCEVGGPGGTVYSRTAALSVFDPAQPEGASFVSHDIPSTMAPGQRAAARIRMRNTSQLSWSLAQGYILGAESDPGGLLLGTTHYPFGSAAEVIPPGGEKEFTVVIQAPGAMGNYAVSFRMRDGSGVPFGTSAGAGVTVGATVDMDFANKGLGWAGGVLAGTGSASLEAGGLCMTVPEAGDNVAGWVSPERLLPLIDGAVYRIRLALSTSQTAANSIPLWNVVYNNFNSSGAGNNYGGEAWFLDVAGGAAGIGRARTQFEVWAAPNAAETPQWRGLVDPQHSAFAPAADGANDMALLIRVLDLESSQINAAIDSGTICVSRIRADVMMMNALTVESTLWNPPIAAATHLPEAFGQGGGGSAWIEDAAGVAHYQLASTGAGSRKSLLPYCPGCPGAQGSLNLGLYPVVWETGTLYRGQADIRSDVDLDGAGPGMGSTEGVDPADTIFLIFDTPTVEMGQTHYSTRGSPGSMRWAASPRLPSTAGGAQTYTGFFYGHTATRSAAQDVNRVRLYAEFFNTPDIAPEGCGLDPFAVTALRIDKIIPPP